MTVKQATLSGELLFLLAASAGATAAHILQWSNTPNGAYRIELADYGAAFRYEMFSSPTSGGPPRKIGKPTSNAEDVVPGFVLSANSKWAAYSQRNTALGLDRQLYSAAVNGSSWQRISQPMAVGGGVEFLTLMWEGAHVGYMANVDGGVTFRRYVVAFTGGRVYEELFRDGFESGNTGGWNAN